MRYWDLYLKLQTELAYGDGLSESNASCASGVHAHLLRLEVVQNLHRGVCIGPGGSAELQALRPHLYILHALTAHRPEAPQLVGADHVEVGDIHDLPYEAGIFDLVYCSNVLEHAFAPYVALLECRRILHEGGIAYFVMPWFDGPEGGRGAFHLHCLDSKVWVELMRKTGFAMADVLVTPGDTGVGGYTVYVGVAVRPPHPHDKLLASLIAHKG